jgi:5'-3' exonuclease
MLFNTNRVGEHVDRVLFAWDGGQKQDKGRAERPPEYEDNKTIAMEWFEFMFGAVNVRIEGIEADDVLATAAINSEADHVIIATADKDLHQLSSSKVSIFDINSKGMVSRREILAKWKIQRPSQIAISLAIQGDSSDKISGIRGWGPKKAIKLFESVTPEMKFEEALAAIQEQIPDSKMGEFLHSLELTLLDSGIPNVPAPSKLALARPDELSNLPAEVTDHYGHVYRMYEEPDDSALNKFLDREG